MDVACEVCGGDLKALGWLGTWQWFRCRDCGVDQHRRRLEIEEDWCIDEEDS